jgi:hypothetical protein
MREVFICNQFLILLTDSGCFRIVFFQQQQTKRAFYSCKLSGTWSIELFTLIDFNDQVWCLSRVTRLTLVNLKQGAEYFK